MLHRHDCLCQAAYRSLAVLLQLSKGIWVQSATLGPVVASLLCFVVSAGMREAIKTWTVQADLIPSLLRSGVPGTFAGTQF